VTPLEKAAEYLSAAIADAGSYREPRTFGELLTGEALGDAVRAVLMAVRELDAEDAVTLTMAFLREGDGAKAFAAMIDAILNEETKA